MSTYEIETPAAVIRAVGAGVPSGRLAVAEVAAGWDQSGGKGAVAVCGADEDAFTLAWSAGVAALGAADVSAETLDALYWGCARPPMAEGPSHAFLAAALGLRTSSGGLLASGSTHAGMDALSAAWDALSSGSAARVLVVASDALIPGPRTGAEKETGAGAVAFVLERPDLDPSTPGAAQLVMKVTRTVPLLDRYRGDGDHATGDPYDPRLYREREFLPAVRDTADSLRAALESGSGGGLPDEARWSLPNPDGRLGKAAAKTVRASVVVSEDLQRTIGDAGSAAPFLAALGGLGAPGPLVILATAGGRTTAVLVEVTASVPGVDEALACLTGGRHGTRAVTYASVLRTRGQLVPLAEPVAMGVPPGSAAFVRGNAELLALTGRKCDECGMIAIPPSIHPVCPDCGSEKAQIVKLGRRGIVHTFVVNYTMPPPFEAPLPMAVVDLGDGSRVLLQGMPEDAAELAIGDEVSLELRRYAVERGVPVYGYKVRRDVHA